MNTPTNATIIDSSGDAAECKLYCFHHAGGSAAAYAPWSTLLPETIGVCAIQLPGRGLRFFESCWQSIDHAVERIGTDILEHADRPFAFFGHSMGAVLAFEVTRWLHRHGHQIPVHLFVSGAVAPSKFRTRHPLDDVSDDALMESLKEINGTDPSVLTHRAFSKLILPMIKSDFKVLASYQYHTAAPLPVPLSVLSGTEDPLVPQADIFGWSAETTRSIEFHWFPGDHFYIFPQRDPILSCVADKLAPRDRTRRVLDADDVAANASA